MLPAVLTATVMVLALPARAAVIDFNTATNDDYLVANYDEDSFRISVVGGHYDIFGPGTWCNLTSGICPNNFLNVDSSVYGPATVQLAQVGGGLFDLASFDVLDVYQYNQQTFQYSSCSSGCVVTSSKGGSQQIVSGTMNFGGADWTGVEWIRIAASAISGSPSIGSTALDNINVSPSAVPVPAAAWLFATGFVGLAGRLRRRRAA